MAQSLLTEVQDFCERMMLPVPASVIDSDDPQVIQVRALLYEAGNSLAVRGDWSRLTFEEVHTTLAQEDQGAIYDITATGATAFRKIKNETMWDRTNQMPVYPINAQDWQNLKAHNSVSPRYRFRLVRHHLMLTPTPPAGHSLAFEWVSKWWIQDGTSGTIKERFTLDTDSFLLERELLKLGLVWRWLRAKGLDYADHYEEYESRLTETLAHDVTRAIVHMDGTVPAVKPGIYIPDYSWNLS